MTFLQMQCYVNIADFEYARDKRGKEYGWGIARYTTPEAFFGREFCERVYSREPEDSKQFLEEHFAKILPHVAKSAVSHFLG